MADDSLLYTPEHHSGVLDHPLHIRLLDGSNFLSIDSSFYSLLVFVPLLFLSLFFLSIPFTNRRFVEFVSPIMLNSSTSFSTNSWRYSSLFDPAQLINMNNLNLVLMRNIFTLSVYLYRYFDKGLLEFFGPLGIFRIINWFGFYIEQLSTGFIPHYGFIFICTITF